MDKQSYYYDPYYKCYDPRQPNAGNSAQSHHYNQFTSDDPYLRQHQAQVQISKQLEVQKQQMMYKLRHVHANTMNTFIEVYHILNKSRNKLEQTNALNKLSSMTFTASMFLYSMGTEFTKKNIWELSELYFDEKKKCAVQMERLAQEMENKKLIQYAEYYFDALNGIFSGNCVDLVETGIQTNEEDDKAQVLGFFNNFIKSDYIHGKALEKIEKDPIANKGITYDQIDREEREKKAKRESEHCTSANEVTYDQIDREEREKKAKRESELCTSANEVTYDQIDREEEEKKAKRESEHCTSANEEDNMDVDPSNTEMAHKKQQRQSATGNGKKKKNNNTNTNTNYP